MPQWFRAVPAILVVTGSVACAPMGSAGGGAGGGESYPRQGPGEYDIPHTVAVNPEGIVTPLGGPAAVKIGLAVFVSEQVALDSAGALVGPGDLARQTEQAMENLIRVVHEARGVPADVVKLTAYLVSDPSDSGQVAAVRETIARRFPKEVPPALTLVRVAGLAPPGALIAVDGIAMLRAEIPDRWRDSR